MQRGSLVTLLLSEEIGSVPSWCLLHILPNESEFSKSINDHNLIASCHEALAQNHIEDKKSRQSRFSVLFIIGTHPIT